MGSDTSLIRIVILSCLPGLVLIIQNGVMLKSSSGVLHDKVGMKEKLMFTLEVGMLIHRTQQERGLMSLYVTSGTLHSIDELVHDAYQRTDEALDTLSGWIHTDAPEYFGSKRKFVQQLNEFRNQSDKLNFAEVVETYTMYNSVFIDWMVGLFERKATGIWAEIVAYHMLINGKECVGIERALGTMFFTTGNISQDTLLWYKGRHELADTFIRQYGVYSKVADEFRSRYINKQVEADVTRMRNQIMEEHSHRTSVQMGFDWFNMTQYIDDLDQVIKAMTMFLSDKTDEEMRDTEIKLVTDIIIVLLAVIAVPLLAFFVYRIAQKMEVIRKNLQEKTIDLKAEQQRTETLMAQMIPAKIAKRIHKKTLQPEYYECVTIMYTDVYNFNMFVSKSTPDELVSLVNDIFDVFEKRIAVHNVTKIGCLGNVLVVGSGLHQRHTNRHVIHVANLALDLLERVQHITSHTTGQAVKMKIGINTGPVVSGIVEGTFPRFCMYGTTTSDAERMMVTCLPQHIQITENTQMILGNNSEFIVRARDDVIKQSPDEPEEQTYWLIENTRRYVQLDDGDLQTLEV